jgi:hypothetical protein
LAVALIERRRNKLQDESKTPPWHVRCIPSRVSRCFVGTVGVYYARAGGISDLHGRLGGMIHYRICMGMKHHESMKEWPLNDTPSH